MGLLETVGGWIKPLAEHRTYERLDDAQVVEARVDPAPLTAGERYIQLSAVTAHLRYSREWFERNLPAVTAVVQERAGGAEHEYARVIGPSEIEQLNVSSIGHVISVNRPIAPMLPFRGGELSLIAGLVAFQVEDNMDRLLDVVGSITRLAAGPQGEAAMGVVSAAARGVHNLFTAGDKDLVVGISHTWRGASDATAPDEGAAFTLREGFWVLLNERPGRDLRRVWLKDGQLLFGDAPYSAEPLLDVDYMVLRLDAITRRDDWREFPAIREALARRDEAMNIASDGAEADRQTRLAMAAVLYSEAFTRADKERILNELRGDLANWKSRGATEMTLGMRPRATLEELASTI